MHRDQVDEIVLGHLGGPNDRIAALERVVTEALAALAGDDGQLLDALDDKFAPYDPGQGTEANVGGVPFTHVRRLLVQARKAWAP